MKVVAESRNVPPDEEKPRMPPSRPELRPAPIPRPTPVRNLAYEQRVNARIDALSAAFGRDVRPILAGTEPPPGNTRRPTLLLVRVLSALALLVAAGIALLRPPPRSQGVILCGSNTCSNEMTPWGSAPLPRVP